MHEDDDDTDGLTLEFEPIEPARFSWWDTAIHVGVCLSNMAACLVDLFDAVTQQCCAAANLKVNQEQARDEGEKFAADVLSALDRL